MELDPKPDEYLIANARAQPHARSSTHTPPARHARTPSQDAVLCFKRALIFSCPWWTSFCRTWLCGLFSWWHFNQRALSHTRCWPALGKSLCAVSRREWVFTSWKHGTSRHCGKGRHHTGVQEESTRWKKMRLLNRGWIPRASFGKLLQTQG